MEWLAQIDFSQMPWYIGVIMIVLTAIVTRMTSRDKVDSHLITQTVERQKQLDDRQGKMMDDLQDELGRFRDELNLVREDLVSERKRNSQLEDRLNAVQEDLEEERKKVSALEQENRELRKENKELKELLEDLKTRFQTN